MARVDGLNVRVAWPSESALSGWVSMNKNYRSAKRNQIMKSSLSPLGISLCLALMSQSSIAADLQSLDVAALPGDKVELKLTFDEPVAVPRG